MAKNLSFNEFIEFANKHYNKGGDSFVECWDESTFEEYTNCFGDITKRKALQMFRTERGIQKDYAGQ